MHPPRRYDESGCGSIDYGQFCRSLLRKHEPVETPWIERSRLLQPYGAYWGGEARPPHDADGDSHLRHPRKKCDPECGYRSRTIYGEVRR